MQATTTKICSILGALTIAGTLSLATGSEPIDWERATELRLKSKQGKSLSKEEKAYLEEAIRSRSQGNSKATRGDSSRNQKASADPVFISEEYSPIKTLEIEASDGNLLQCCYRAPKADLPLPAVVFFHGGLGTRRLYELVENTKTGPTPTRFLNAGFVSVCGTFRTYGASPNSRGPILDAIAIVEAVKKLPEVDPDNVIVFGGSGGGSIVLELAGSPRARPLAAIAGEPATVLFTGVMTSIENREDSMQTFQERYTPQRKKETEAKINAISCPILIHHGDQHPLRKINFELVFPSMEKLRKELTVKIYPGEQHGFYWGNHTTTETVEKVVESSLNFIRPLLTCEPAKIPDSAKSSN